MWFPLYILNIVFLCIISLTPIIQMILLLFLKAFGLGLGLGFLVTSTVFSYIIYFCSLLLTLFYLPCGYFVVLFLTSQLDA